MSPRELVREMLAELFKIGKDNTFRVIKVEEIGNYTVYIQVPGSKSSYDFFVWRAIFDKNNIDIKIPSHDDLGKMYLYLKNLSPLLDEHLINAVLRFIRDRKPLEEVIQRYFKELSNDRHIIDEVKKFLLTLKWIALQEDANYPPPHLGSLYAFSVFAVLEVTKDLSSVRKIIRFKKKN